MREERERERMQSQSWSPSGTSRTRSYHQPIGKPPATPTKTERSMSSLVTPRNSTFGESINPWLMDTPSQQTRFERDPIHHDSGESTLREGKAWKVVPEEAIAMVIAIGSDETKTQERSLFNDPFFGDGTHQALLVWFVPFNADSDDRPTTASTSSSSTRPAPQARSGSESSSSKPVTETSSLPKFQKLLRRHQSKDKDAMKRDKSMSTRTE